MRDWTMAALLILPLVLSAPLQAPFLYHETPTNTPALAIEPHDKPEVLKAGFSSKGAGIPVLHDLCSGYDLVKVFNAGESGESGETGGTSEASVYVYHAPRGFCVSLFGPDTDVSVTITSSIDSAVEPTTHDDADIINENPDKVLERKEAMGDMEGELYDERGPDLEGAGAQVVKGATEMRRDGASWTGRGSMPGSLRLRTIEDCVRILAEVGGKKSDTEVCLGS
ncbi:hypothetical protein A1Q2_01577 [Trichosporon asahii var. asahii CBS 8904]|uniref:Uncharacterized protein n=1 Tax=Trichosporon asahii var. asahii (strain CBS 8904) TaxID=1220162 RepID=K1VX87_TRIAC|nr:hypothetical protein A1Q2_01577 [Trichosporon asahii var. asahii CBS 8904]